MKLLSTAKRHALPSADPPELEAMLGKVRPFTMAATESLAELGRQVYAALVCGIPGAFVECGTWRGGSSFLMAFILKQFGELGRKVWMFDSFEGRRGFHRVRPTRFLVARSLPRTQRPSFFLPSLSLGKWAPRRI